MAVGGHPGAKLGVELAHVRVLSDGCCEERLVTHAMMAASDGASEAWSEVDAAGSAAVGVGGVGEGGAGCSTGTAAAGLHAGLSSPPRQILADYRAPEGPAGCLAWPQATRTYRAKSRKNVISHDHCLNVQGLQRIKRTVTYLTSDPTRTWHVPFSRNGPCSGTPWSSRLHVG